MALDIKFCTLCSHWVNNIQYSVATCPRCNGRGWYMDIMFDPAGDAIATGGAIKMQQECIKVLFDQKHSDLFYPNWGSEIHDFIGKKNTTAIRSRLEMCIRRAIERLKAIQEHEALTNASVTDSEIIKNIEYIYLEPVSVTDWHCKIAISNKLDETFEFAVDLTI